MINLGYGDKFEVDGDKGYGVSMISVRMRMRGW